jgi:hypothetical protein
LALRRFLAVEGCYWACPYELAIISEPLFRPLPELFRAEALDVTVGWDQSNFRYRVGQQAEKTAHLWDSAPALSKQR